MADNLTTLGLLTLSQTYRGDIVNQINKSVQLLKLIPIQTGVGKNCAWTVEKGGELVENYNEGEDAVNFGSTTQYPAILTWGLYRANPHVTQLALDTSSTSYDPKGNRDLWARQVIAHASALAVQMNGDLFTGTGTSGGKPNIVGLGTAIGTASNTYAIIDGSAGATNFWNPTIVDPGTPTAPTLQDLRDDVRQVYEAAGQYPDVALCAPVVFNYIGGLFDATRRQVEMVTTARGPVRLDAGFAGLELDGMVFIKDRQCQSTVIYYLNTAFMHLEVLPSATSNEAMLEELNMDFGDVSDGYGPVPLSYNLQMLAKTGASSKAQMTITSQLVVTQRNKFGTRKNVAVS